MHTAQRSTRRPWVGSLLLLLVVLGAGAGLATWKQQRLEAAALAAAAQPEPAQTVTAATASERRHRRTTTAIGTVVALRSITLHNELAGTVRQAALQPGAVVEPGTVLVALDVAVETAELQALQARAELAANVLQRMQRAQQQSAASAVDVDRAAAERDVALAEVARLQAVIARKTIRAPFKARIGMADVHEGQYLHEGTQLTTLQGVDDAVHVDFAVTQTVAAGLRAGEAVDVLVQGRKAPVRGSIVAVDARVDPATRNAAVRARLDGGDLPAPGASVRVLVPVGAAETVVTVPVTALRKGPAGDVVFVLQEAHGQLRAGARPVQSGSMLGDEVVIRTGLEVGETVAASGSFKLYDHALVQVAAAADAGR